MERGRIGVGGVILWGGVGQHGRLVVTRSSQASAPPTADAPPRLRTKQSPPLLCRLWLYSETAWESSLWTVFTPTSGLPTGTFCGDCEATTPE
jgi:hypothetical protein